MKKLIALFSFVILSFQITAQKPLQSFSASSTAFLTVSDSLIYLTRFGAVNALSTSTRLDFCTKISSQKDSIISLLNQGLLLKEIKILSQQNQVSQQAEIITAQKKRIFWRGVEIWGYRIGIAGGIYLLLFR